MNDILKMGPLETVVLRSVGQANEGRAAHRYALIVFKDEESVLFATECMDGIRMFGQELSVRPKQGTEQVIVVCFGRFFFADRLIEVLFNTLKVLLPASIADLFS